MNYIYNKLTANVILYCDILKPLFLKSETRLGLSLPSLLFNIILHMHLHQLIYAREARIYIGEKTVSSKSGLGMLDSYR